MPSLRRDLMRSGLAALALILQPAIAVRTIRPNNLSRIWSASSDGSSPREAR